MRSDQISGNGTTSSILCNMIRDSLQAIGTGNLSCDPVKNINQGWSLTDAKNDAYFWLLAGGGAILNDKHEVAQWLKLQALVPDALAHAVQQWRLVL